MRSAQSFSRLFLRKVRNAVQVKCIFFNFKKIKVCTKLAVYIHIQGQHSVVEPCKNHQEKFKLLVKKHENNNKFDIDHFKTDKRRTSFSNLHAKIQMRL